MSLTSASSMSTIVFHRTLCSLAAKHTTAQMSVPLFQLITEETSSFQWSIFKNSIGPYSLNT